MKATSYIYMYVYLEYNIDDGALNHKNYNNIDNNGNKIEKKTI